MNKHKNVQIYVEARLITPPTADLDRELGLKFLPSASLSTF